MQMMIPGFSSANATLFIYMNFISGYGSVLNELGQVEMDAMIIRGSDLATGGVGALAHVRNPISVARAVMDKTKHVFLAGQGAEDFAKTHGFEIVENADLVTPRAKAQLEAVLAKTAIASTETGGGYFIINSYIDIHYLCICASHLDRETGLGTVGAVAINGIGKLAAATSTGGIAGKLAGRIGDTPIIGGGTYCDDLSCGISATGLGESIMRYCLSSKIAAYIDNGLLFYDSNIIFL
jgi:beta-aspartyl-peptidase (threonine type)